MCLPSFSFCGEVIRPKVKWASCRGWPSRQRHAAPAGSKWCLAAASMVQQPLYGAGSPSERQSDAGIGWAACARSPALTALAAPHSGQLSCALQAAARHATTAMRGTPSSAVLAQSGQTMQDCPKPSGLQQPASQPARQPASQPGGPAQAVSGLHRKPRAYHYSSLTQAILLQSTNPTSL